MKFIRKKANFGKNGEHAKNSSEVWSNIQIRWHKEARWQLAIFRKMTSFAKMANLARRSQKLEKKLKQDDKQGISANGYYNESGKLGNNSLKVCINSTEMTKETGWLLAIFANISELAKIANLARIDERFVKNLGRIHERFVQNLNEMKSKSILANGDFSKWANFCQKIVTLTKVHQMFGKNS